MSSAVAQIFNGLGIQARAPGRITAIMGPSGTGKTTLLRLITGQIEPTARQRAGLRADVAGSLSAARAVRAAPAHGHAVPERRAADRHLRVRERRLPGARALRACRKPLIRQLVLTKLHAVGLRGAAQPDAAELSGGMARRVALARAIVMDPEVLIYDEPFVGLDPISMGVIVRLIRQMNDALGITSIVVSHDVEELAAHRRTTATCCRRAR
jgi:phospholipid/cholesterol/gamma-HCH transport system ATP-binding protein